MMRQEKRHFLEQVDYCTSPGYLTGGDARARSALPGGGPFAVISDKAIFRFDGRTKEMHLAGTHPGVTVEGIRRSVSWDLKTARDLTVTPSPSDEELRIIRTLDPMQQGSWAYSFQ
jgi:glutaconate CoA-transferase, subunit B